MKQVVAGCLQEARATEDGFVATYRFPPGLEVFSGHFPEIPLVPGVFLVEAVRCGAESVLGHELAIARVTDAKFTAEVAPDTLIRIEATLDGEKCGAFLTLPDQDGVAARIRLVLRPVA